MKCISCNNSELKKYSDTSYLNLPIYCCKKCGLCVTGESEDVARQAISEIYTGKYWDERNSEISIQTDYSDVDSQGKKRNWLSQISYCSNFLKDKKTILEIGAGAGQASYWFEKSGFIVTGIEPDKRNSQLINQKLKHGKCISSFIEDLDMTEKFDIIWMSHVLEHLIRPDIFLQKINNNLNPSGIFFIEVPNCENQSLLKSTILTQPHTYHFSQKSLANICQNAGFRILASDYFRPASYIEGGINKFVIKCSRVLKFNPYPYYPRIKTDAKHGRDLRIILSLA